VTAIDLLAVALSVVWFVGAYLLGRIAGRWLARS
jgi:hypothetical protein